MVKTRRTRIQEKKLASQIVKAIIASIAILLMLVVFGPALLVRFSLLVNPKESLEHTYTNKTGFIAPPTLDTQVTATNSATVKLTGTGKPGTKVRIYHNMKQIKEVLTDKDGIFIVRSVLLNEGKNSFTATTVKDNDESEYSQEVEIIYKSKKPEIKINEPEPGSTLTQIDPEITIRGRTDPDIRLTINNHIVPVSGNGSFSYRVKLNEGENKLHVKAVDVAENETIKEVSFTYSP